MESLIIAISVLILCLIGLIILPSHLTNTKTKITRHLITLLLGVDFILAFIMALLYAVKNTSPLYVNILNWSSGKGSILSIYYDGATSLMILLVSFIGFVVSRFSIRYLDGEASQGRYFQWIGFTVGAVSLMIAAGNLLLFFAAWVMTSFGLHHLLVHYDNRPAAQKAAWTKFTISRLGDAFLVSAIILTFKTFGTLELPELIEQSKDLAGSSQVGVNHIAIGWLLVLGAITKSAQFPFHIWLPDTMETPTTVSALMHAGIVNAGGYLIIRMSPLVTLSSGPLNALLLIGTFTVCYASIVMVTQSSVKKTLAYSTIAQMGFMMLQCGLGAFSAAMLHIIAHSLYKAHAFLNSGNVIAHSHAYSGVKAPAVGRINALVFLAGTAVLTAFAYFGVLYLSEIDVTRKPGGLILSFVMCLALTTWGWQLFLYREQKTSLLGFVGFVGLSSVYFVSYKFVDHLLTGSIPDAFATPLSLFIVAPVASVFIMMLALHILLKSEYRPCWLEVIRIHASNGFYIDKIYQRVIASLANS